MSLAEVKEPAIAQISKTIRKDARPLYYKNSSFTGRYCETRDISAGTVARDRLVKWLYVLGPVKRKLIITDLVICDPSARYEDTIEEMLEADDLPGGSHLCIHAMRREVLRPIGGHIAGHHRV